MSDEHDVSVLREMRSVQGKEVPRYRGLCSCTWRTYMHYSTPEAARTATRRIHLASPTNRPERNIHD